MAVRKLPGNMEKFLINLLADPKSAVKKLSKALVHIHMTYGGFQYIHLAYHKNGQLKTLLAFSKEIF
ncbi:MAG: hypothetical protein A3I92_03010 [Candidatus Yanofskybacteria bacterium RIFCSPLOWO2_02_FULL_43_10b]|uniref:Uncharacterized protein n=1 Tax=Candidatus Yanofskybacteria bacterium RIFCSPLOWO2_02_FULL_43_10b TaxID=1802704 RepID=A0A1F8H4Q5_9BACT|nr:MAG: hypothetical protein A3I92_03010 [Candidatus Yanofskybacteria bacterium RIFCSPLOWO2_02_FULL_43_10b]